MTAITIHEPGTVNNVQVRDLPVPAILEHEVLIKVKAAGVNPVDWKGLAGGTFAMPYILGSDVAGVVVEAGAAVTKFKVGDQVMGSLNWAKQGAFAEYVASDASFFIHIPDGLSFEQAAAVPMASLTAWQALFDHLVIKPGQKLLIHAAAGGVGIFALQFAKWAGAVVTVTGSEKNRSFLQALGADDFIDYNKPVPAQYKGSFDAVLDSIESVEASYQLMKRGGKYVSIVSLSKPLLPALAAAYGVIASKFLFTANTDQLLTICGLIEQHTVKIFIGKTFPLPDAQQALLYQQQGHSRGKNVLMVE